MHIGAEAWALTNLQGLLRGMKIKVHFHSEFMTWPDVHRQKANLCETTHPATVRELSLLYIFVTPSAYKHYETGVTWNTEGKHFF